MPVDALNEPTSAVSQPEPETAARDRTWLFDAGIIFVVAVFLRLVLVGLSRGGPGGDFGYDAGVYYNAADALIHGRLPYQDFLLLHPPGVMLVLSPVAGLGQLIGDHAAFMVGNTLFAVFGGVSAVLVMAIVRRMGLSRGAALVGGLFYAVWFGAVFSEVSARLEPLGSLALLLGMWALTGERGRRALVLGGAALGFAASVKIYWVVPLVILLAWQFGTRPRRDALRALLGAVVAMLLVNGPFFVVAPTAMWRMVVSDQLQRGGNAGSLVHRFGQLSSVSSAFPSADDATLIVVEVVVTVVLVALAVSAWRHPPARVAVVLAVAEIALLFSIPVYNPYYSGFAAAGLAILVAVGYHRHCGVRLAGIGPVLASAALTLVLVLTVVSVFVRQVSVTGRFAQGLGPRVAHVRCLVADSPIALIELDSLSRSLANDCPNWVDVTGHTYDDDRAKSGTTFRHRNKPWQKAIRGYLLSGDAFVVVRRATGMNKRSRKLLHSYPVLVRRGGVVVRTVVGRAGP